MKEDKLFKSITLRLQKEGAKKIAVFGSYARRENKAGSDIDLLVEFKKRKTLLDLVRIERQLSEEVGAKIDLLSEEELSPYIRDSVHKEMRILLQ